jgi:hypothetical protein
LPPRAGGLLPFRGRHRHLHQLFRFGEGVGRNRWPGGDAHGKGRRCARRGRGGGAGWDGCRRLRPGDGASLLHAAVAASNPNGAWMRNCRRVFMAPRPHRAPAGS